MRRDDQADQADRHVRRHERRENVVGVCQGAIAGDVADDAGGRAGQRLDRGVAWARRCVRPTPRLGAPVRRGRTGVRRRAAGRHRVLVLPLHGDVVGRRGRWPGRAPRCTRLNSSGAGTKRSRRTSARQSAAPRSAAGFGEQCHQQRLAALVDRRRHVRKRCTGSVQPEIGQHQEQAAQSARPRSVGLLEREAEVDGLSRRPVAPARCRARERRSRRQAGAPVEDGPATRQRSRRSVDVGPGDGLDAADQRAAHRRHAHRQHGQRQVPGEDHQGSPTAPTGPRRTTGRARAGTAGWSAARLHVEAALEELVGGEAAGR